MLEKLKRLEERFNELSKMLIQPDIISDQSKYIKISKEYKDLKTVVCLLYTSDAADED